VTLLAVRMCQMTVLLQLAITTPILGFAEPPKPNWLHYLLASARFLRPAESETTPVQALKRLLGCPQPSPVEFSALNGRIRSDTACALIVPTSSWQRPAGVRACPIPECCGRS